MMQDRPAWILAHPDGRTSQRVKVCLAYLATEIARHRAALGGEAPLAAAEVSG